MKKIFIFLFIIILNVSLAACDFISTTQTSPTTISTEISSEESSSLTTSISSASSTTAQTTTSVSNSQITTEEITSTESTTEVSTTTELITTQTTTSQSTTTTTTSETTTTTTTTTHTTETTTESTTTQGNLPFIPEGYNLLQDELEEIGIPATGDVKVLVFVVDFSDSAMTDAAQKLLDVNLAFNGSSNDLVYESLNSYYLKSSFGKLNITADIFGVYRASQPAQYYEDNYEDSYVESDLIFEILTYYDDQINFTDYDANNDGFIDGIYIIYNYPVSYDSGSDLWWAYQYYYLYNDLFDGMNPNFYTWSGMEFFYENNEPVNARTIIHETGHMLGLEDYYDYYPYDNFNKGGLGTYMMDYTLGDHDPFSKILLGWITPLVVDKTMTVDIMPHIENGEVLLIIDEWNNTIFDEYLLVAYYTPEGLNELDQEYIFTIPGIVIFHISAAIDNGYNPDSYYYSIFNNNNTDSFDKLIKIIEADMGGDIEVSEIVENSDLFQTGDILGQNIYPNYKWYNLTFAV